MPSTETLAEARRLTEICNACRYCEGYCPVFPAMTLQRSFSDGDLGHLANLCHNCKGCYHACQYAPPHPFAVNLPRTYAELRVEIYQDCAWPRPLARLFERNGLAASIITALSLGLVLLLSMMLVDDEAFYGSHSGPGSFYAVIPYDVMVYTAGGVFMAAVLALGMGVRNYLRLYGRRGDVQQGVHDAMTLRHLSGGGHGCNDVDEGFGQARRWFHQATMWGFLLCFAATSVATIYDHVFGWIAPYSYASAPVLLGLVGGVALTIGAAGLFVIKIMADPAPVAKKTLGMDYGLLALLFFTSVTGLALLFWRETSAMGGLLAVHLGFVLALFLMVPYGKFVHGLYRLAALIRYHGDRKKAGAG